MEIIRAENLTKSYIISENPLVRFGHALKRSRTQVEQFTALENINLSVNKGEAVGIIGKNGSGKSTLLKILAGISECDSGVCSIRGSVSALLELGVGFNSEYSGIQNIYLNGIMNGFSKNDIKNRINEILEFAEIDDKFADMPIKMYSSGMAVRLAFASMIWLDTDIILVDEALAVGDLRFQSKCYKKFEELKARGKTILFVSHDIDAVRRFCTKAVWLSDGKIADCGEVDIVTSRYMQSCVSGGISVSADIGEDAVLNRYGSAVGCIKSIAFSKEEYEFGDEITAEILIDYPVEADPEFCGVCLSVKDKYGLDLCVFRTESKLKRGLNTVRFRFKNLFNSGEYFAAVGVENKASVPISYYEYAEGAAKIKSCRSTACETEQFGLIVMPCEIIINQE